MHVVSCVNARMYICVCVCGQAFTLYFALKAVSVLLRRWFLVGLLVVLLGTLIIVVHPLNCILLQEKTIKGLVWNPNTTARKLHTIHMFFLWLFMLAFSCHSWKTSYSAECPHKDRHLVCVYVHVERLTLWFAAVPLGPVLGVQRHN